VVGITIAANLALHGFGLISGACTAPAGADAGRPYRAATLAVGFAAFLEMALTVARRNTFIFYKDKELCIDSHL
jgi:hypothetical protein